MHILFDLKFCIQTGKRFGGAHAIAEDEFLDEDYGDEYGDEEYGS